MSERFVDWRQKPYCLWFEKCDPKPKQIDEWDAKFAACSQCGLRILLLLKVFVYILSSKCRYVWKLRLRFENVGEERENFCEFLNWALIWSFLYHHIKSSVLCSKLYEFHFGVEVVWQRDYSLICHTWFFSVCLTKLQMSAKTLNLKRMNRLSTIDKKVHSFKFEKLYQVFSTSKPNFWLKSG